MKPKKNHIYLVSSPVEKEKTREITVESIDGDTIIVKVYTSYDSLGKRASMTVEDFNKKVIKEVCRYCCGVDHVTLDSSYIMKGSIDILVDEYGDLAVLSNDSSKYKKIKYCPMCGRRLPKSVWKGAN